MSENLKVVVEVKVIDDDSQEHLLFHHSAVAGSETLDIRFRPDFASDALLAIGFSKQTLKEAIEMLAKGDIVNAGDSGFETQFIEGEVKSND